MSPGRTAHPRAGRRLALVATLATLATLVPTLAPTVGAGGLAGAQAPTRVVTVATHPVGAAARLSADDPRLVRALDARTRTALAGTFDLAATRGLPVEPLVAKALEGVEKGAAPPRVERAVRALADRLEAARVALEPAVSGAEVIAGADALAVGVPADVLRRVRALSQRRSAAVAIGVLAQLVSRGVAPAHAAEAVVGLLRRGAAPQQLLALDGAVQLDVASGVAPATALELRADALAGALPLAGAAGGLGDGALNTTEVLPAAPGTVGRTDAGPLPMSGGPPVSGPKRTARPKP